MLTLEEISQSITMKRNPSLDGFFKLPDLSLSAYDIRTSRNVENMTSTLKRDGQKQAITIAINGKERIVVNGRTRYEGAKLIGLNGLICEVYENLTQLEQDYLNALINTNQAPLTTDEKLRFVQQHNSELSDESLRKALGLASLTQVKAFKNVAFMDETARETLTQNKKGRERGTFEIETANLVSRVKEVEPQRIFAKHASNLIDRDITDRTRRTEIREKTTKYNELVKEKDKLHLTEKEIAKIVVETPMQSLSNLGSIAKGSEGKFKAYWELLNSENFERVIIFNPTLPYMNGSPTSKSECLMTVELSQLKPMEVIPVDKDSGIVEIWRKQNVKVIEQSAESYIFNTLTPSNKKTLVYFNFSGNRDAREFYSPALINGIKELIPNVVIAFVICELQWKTHRKENANYLELLRTFGFKGRGVKTIEDYLTAMGYNYIMLWEKRLDYGISNEDEENRTALVAIN